MKSRHCRYSKAEQSPGSLVPVSRHFQVESDVWWGAAGANVSSAQIILSTDGGVCNNTLI